MDRDRRDTTHLARKLLGAGLTVVISTIALSAGCFTSSEVSCQEDADCFPSQVCNQQRNVCEEGSGVNGGGRDGSATGGNDTSMKGGDGGCTSSESNCWDDKDNDCDGDTDCEDPDCMGKRCGVSNEGTGAVCKGVEGGDVECRENNCCNCKDDDGDTINDYGIEEGAEQGITEAECRDDENPTCGERVRELCSCTYRPGNEDTMETGVCTSAATDPDGTCQPPPNFEADETSTGDGKDNDCDGETDESG